MGVTNKVIANAKNEVTSYGHNTQMLDNWLKQFLVKRNFNGEIYTGGTVLHRVNWLFSHKDIPIKGNKIRATPKPQEL